MHASPLRTGVRAASAAVLVAFVSSCAGPLYATDSTQRPAAITALPPPSSSMPPGVGAPTDVGVQTETTPPRSTTSPTTSPPSTRPPLRTFTMSFSGDLLLHSPLVRHAKRVAGGTGYDFRPMFARIRSTVSRADLAICHLETPVAPPGEAPSTFPLYGVPAQVATAIKWAGYDRCSTASNHAMDRGVKGIDATVNALTRAGVAQTGMARRAAEAVAPVFTVKGVRVTHLSYTYGFNGIRLPRNEPWRSNRYDPDRVIREARNARARGAEYVVVSIHWGTERVAAPNSQQVSGAKAIMASKAVDLIVGHHAHVLQPIASVNQRWVVYGMGNLLSNMPTGSTWPAASQDADLVNITVTERASGGFITAKPVVHPTWCDRRNGWVIRLVQADLANPNVPTSIKTSLRASLARTRKVLGGYVPR